jgi:DNA-binding Xre family transcriptional regulator
MIEVRLVPRIREILRERGRRPCDLARDTGIDPAPLTRIMDGKPVTLMTALNIAAALGKRVEEIWIMKEVDV